MRFIVSVAAVLVLATGMTPPVSRSIPLAGGSVLTAAQQQPAAAPKADIDIHVNRGDTVWWTSPVWIAIGAIALVLLVVIIAMLVRGGGTTVIKE